MCYDWTWRRFIKFLKENDCYEQYIFNYKNMGDRWKKEYFSEKHHIKLYNAREYVCIAFEWSKTKEGRLYWLSIDIDWRSIADKFIYT